MQEYTLIKHNEDFSKTSREVFMAENNQAADGYVKGLLAHEKGLRGIGKWKHSHHSPSILFVTNENGPMMQVGVYRLNGRRR